MAVVIQFRRGKAADWSAVNPILAEGELGAELDTDLFKIGDGLTAWNSLPYAQRGPKGNDGATGATGPAGAASTVPGPKGEKGDKGDKGDIGFTGGTGTSGANGYTPVKGIDYLDGVQGLPGEPGEDGRTILYGVGVPASDLGVSGDFYLNTTDHSLYGPKNGTIWGSPVSLIGPPEPDPSEYQSSFSWGDATPAVLAEVDAGKTVYSITLVILEPFNGDGASLSVGVAGNPELFMAASECDPKTTGVYCVTPGYRFASAGTLRLFITPGAGASAGHGVVMIDF
jgi:hypothetical protein